MLLSRILNIPTLLVHRPFFLRGKTGGVHPSGRQIGPREFHAGNRVAMAPYRRGISDGTQFLDPWRNPYMVRGVPREQAEMSRPLNEVRHKSVCPIKSAVILVFAKSCFFNLLESLYFREGETKNKLLD